MAVLARTQITLSAVVDIQAVYKYYKLQSSTSTKPSKPTSISTLPPSGWTATEPTYTSGSTNTLYTVELTVFTDGSFSYSDVMTDSAYEAAKAAYNKAVAAANAADAAQEDIDAQKEWFWHDTAGAHVLGDTSGYRNDLNSTGMHIIDTSDGTEVARFAADGAQIGAADGSHSLIDADGFSVSNNDGDVIFETKSSGATANAPKTFILDKYLTSGTTVILSKLDDLQSGDFIVHLKLTLCRNASDLYYQKSVNLTYTKGTSASGSHVINTSQNDVTITCRYDGNKSFTFVSASPTTTSANYPIIITGQKMYGISYDVSIDAPYYTLGARSGDSGGFSFIAGNGLYATDDYQAALGKYNKQEEDSVLTIGNGTSNSTRSNALSVDWSGNMVLAGGLTANADSEINGDLDVTGQVTQVPVILNLSADASGAADVSSISTFQVVKCGNLVMLTLELTMSATASAWESIATELPVPAGNVAIVGTAMAWGASFQRNLRVSLASGNLQVRYGAAGTYRITMTYICV